ncbi:hypothetical protein E4U17_002717 [Claviceps sp. LM77 group G4]|nr:hypothetical protein E4U17_002717 [Claviceps sp. LM77 group G4]KAG6077678.1 hypothetical protein E4U16_002062 [Claviceps sp. LM84 group G4]
MQKLSYLGQTIEIILEPRVLCPFNRPTPAALLRTELLFVLLPRVKVDDNRAVHLVQHDIVRADVIVDNIQGMQVTNTTLDALEATILIKRRAGFHSLFKGLFVFSKTDARDSTVDYDATSVFDDIGNIRPLCKTL